jgi:uncharacterized membrane protein
MEISNMQQKPSQSMSMAGTVVYGLFIIVPFSIVFLLLVKLTEILESIATPLGLESAFGAMVALIIAIIAALTVVLLFSWIVGSIFRKAVSYDKFEGAILKKIPGYQIIANITRGFSAGKTAYPPVLIELHGPGVAEYGFVMEEHDNDLLTVFIPSTPVLTVGNLYVVDRERVTYLTAGTSEIADCITQWGTGSKKIIGDASLSSNARNR